MREVSIHLEYQGVVASQSPLESRNVGRAESELASAMNDVHAWIGGRHSVNDSSRSVRRPVVYNKYLERRILRQHRRNDVGDIVVLVVRGDDHQRFLRQPFSVQQLSLLR